MNFYKDNKDLQWYVEKGIAWDELVQLTEYRVGPGREFESAADAVEFYREILEMFGEVVPDLVVPRVRELDEIHPRLEDGEVVESDAMRDILGAFREMGLFGMCIPRELGGMNAPLMLYFLTSEMLARADVSLMTHYGFHGGIGLAMLAYSVDEGTTEVDIEEGKVLRTRFEKEIREVAAGEAWGSMDITEPDAGSDMAALRSRAELDDEGNWRLTGQKIYITSGHGKYHIVIARTEPDREGLDALSLFLVRAWTDREDGTRERHIQITRLEEKIGHNASATCAVEYERAPAELIGKRGEGFKGMLLLMNNARVGVGFECLGLCETAWRMARDYAAERRSMGKTIDRHEMIADYLDEMETDICAIRALAVHSGFAEEKNRKLDIVLRYENELPAEERSRMEAEQREAAKLARRLTPLLKYLAAEKSVEMARKAIQIHGGAGYTKDYGAEKLVRDALVMPIYEGTSQIQSLMAMKDTLMGIMKEPQRFLREMAETRVRSLSATDPLERRVARIRWLTCDVQQLLIRKTATDKARVVREKPMAEWKNAFLQNWDPKRDFAFAMLHAERLIRMLIDVAVLEILQKQVEIDAERRPLLEAYLERAEPRCRAMHDEIFHRGERILAKLAQQRESEASAAE